MKDDAPTSPLDDVPAPAPSITEPRVRLISVDVDDRDTLDRVIRALADALAGRVG